VRGGAGGGPRLGSGGPGASPFAGLLVEGGPGVADLHALYGIVGRTASQSMSPTLHNAGYRALGLSALYLPFDTGHLLSFWRHLATPVLGTVEALVKGFTITAPYKEAALRAAGATTLAAERAGAANILLRQDRGWMADTTDT
jgi:shikimate 5-dehydrogenase